MIAMETHEWNLEIETQDTNSGESFMISWIYPCLKELDIPLGLFAYIIHKFLLLFKPLWGVPVFCDQKSPD